MRATRVQKTAHESAKFELCMVQALGKLTEVFRLLLWEKSKNHGLSPIQIQFLIYLRNHKPHFRKVSCLAREFNLTKATVSDAVRVMEIKNLIERCNDEKDARSQYISLTDHGVAVTRELKNFANPMLLQFRKMEPGDRITFYLQIMNLVKHLGESGYIHPARMCINCNHFEKVEERKSCRYLNLNLEESDLRFDCSVHSTITS